MRHPRRKKKARRDKLVIRVREQFVDDPRFSVRVPMRIKDADPATARDLLLDALRAFPLPSSVTAADSEITATIEVAAAGRSEAKMKALYWIKRAAELSGRLSFSGQGIGQIDVQEL